MHEKPFEKAQQSYFYLQMHSSIQTEHIELANI